MTHECAELELARWAMLAVQRAAVSERSSSGATLAGMAAAIGHVQAHPTQSPRLCTDHEDSAWMRGVVAVGVRYAHMKLERASCVASAGRAGAVCR